MIDENNGAFGGKRFGKGNRSTWSPVSVPVSTKDPSK
jgi:hypothetical protein